MKSLTKNHSHSSRASSSSTALAAAIPLLLTLGLTLGGCGGGGSSPNGSSVNSAASGGGTSNPNDQGGSGSGGGDSGNGGGDDGGQAAVLVQRATTALPPGQSGFFSAQGQANGAATGNPADYGPNIDDQRALYWSFQSKDGAYHKKGDPEIPKAGVEIYYDEFGIPAVYASNIGDAWFGAGYAIAKQRLFLMDAVRRLGNGNFAELLGCGSIADDVMQRTLSYSDAEYQQFFDEAHEDSQASVMGYAAGVNAWLAQVRANPTENLPAEYSVVLSRTAEQIDDFTVKDLLASGVFITRSVATDGGTEWQNIRALRALEAEFGKADGRQAFLDLNWFEDELAASSIPRSVGLFNNHPETADGRESVFNVVADWATALPDSLEHGPGTGVFDLPIDCQGSTGSVFGGLGDPQGQTKSSTSNSKIGNASTNNSAQSQLGKTDMEPIGRAVRAVRDWGAGLHGGSYMAVLRDPLTENGSTYMVNGPQLGYSYPSQLVEIEIHGGEYNARGSTVPGLPAVGIGYNEFNAWGLTTGYSKTIDSFIDTICSNSQQTAGSCNENQYFHNNSWKDMDCRTETINYRLATSVGVPIGEPNRSLDIEICRTIHGPIVARDNEAGLARSLSYAMWKGEIKNIDPIREWARSTSFQQIDDEAEKLTWNENLMVASKDGNIAFYHPGLYPKRHAATDQRFPIPGDGSRDFNGTLSWDEMPKLINPDQGYIANWNNKPAHGWLGGEGISSHSRPGGSRERVSVIQDLIEKKTTPWVFDELQDFDRRLGTIDPKADGYRGAMLGFAIANNATLTDRQRAALQQLIGWDGTFYDYNLDIDDEEAKALPPTTIFTYWVNAIRDELFSSLKDMQIDGFQTPGTDEESAADDDSVFDRQAGVGNHVFDMSVLDNLAVRILSPSSSSLTARFDWEQGRSANAILETTLNTALDQLAADFNSSDVTTYQRPHPRSRVSSLTGGVVGPDITMPYQDRGSWNQIIGWEPAAETSPDTSP